MPAPPLPFPPSADTGTGYDTPNYEVYVGQIQPDSSDAAYEDVQGDPAAIWSDYMIVNRYESDRRIYMMSLCTPPQGAERVLTGGGGAAASITSTATISANLQGSNKPKVAFVQLGGPTLLWICDWTVCRAKRKPIAPEPEVGGDWILLDEWIEPVRVTVMDDGTTPLYRLSGTYFYGCTNPATNPLANMNFPRPPWLTDKFDRTMTPDMFDKNLSNIPGAQRAAPAQPIHQ